MTAFHPPADPDRCRAIVLVAGQRGRCRGKRFAKSDLCWDCLAKEARGDDIAPRVPEPKESQS